MDDETLRPPYADFDTRLTHEAAQERLENFQRLWREWQDVRNAQNDIRLYPGQLWQGTWGTNGGEMPRTREPLGIQPMPADMEFAGRVERAFDPTLEIMPANVALAEQAPDIFARQQSIPLELPAAVSLVGVGGVGSWIGYLLALAGCPKLYLFDSDKVSDTNLNRSPYGPDALGKAKTDALAQLIKNVRPHCKTIAYPNFGAEFASSLSLMADEDDGACWVVPSTDTWASRKEAFKWCRDQAFYYIEVAAEGEFGSVAGEPAEWATADEENPGYATVPVWVGPAVAAALMACNHILHGRGVGRDQSARLGWLQNDDHNRMEFQYRRGE